MIIFVLIFHGRKIKFESRILKIMIFLIMIRFFHGKSLQCNVQILSGSILMIILMTSLMTDLYFDDAELKNEVLTDMDLDISRRIDSFPQNFCSSN